MSSRVKELIRRVVLYIRESTEDQARGVAPEVQRKAMTEFAVANDLDIVGEYLDLHSGWRDSEKRPQFSQMLKDAVAGKFDIVLVYDTSRFARDRVLAATTKRTLRDELGIEVISVTQPFISPDHPMSIVAEGVFELFDEVSSIVTSKKVTDALRLKAENGYLRGLPPWGYFRKPGDTNRVHVDKVKARYVRRAYEKSAKGMSDLKIAHWLNQEGQLSARGRAWGKDSVRHMLTNNTYAGFLSSQRGESKAIRGQHEAIVTEELFDRVASIRRRRWTGGQPGRPSRGYSGSKLLLCDACGARLHAHALSNNRTARYACKNRKMNGSCRQPYVTVTALDIQIGELISGLKPPEEVKRAVARRLRSESQGTPAAVADKKRAQLLAARENFGQLFVWQHVDKAKYLFEIQRIDSELDALDPPVPVDLEAAASALMNFGLFWERETDGHERNKLLHVIFEALYVRDGRIVAVTPREAFLLFFDFGDAKKYVRASKGGQLPPRE